MRENKKIIVGGVLLIAIVLVAVGFAAIGSKTLTISGNTTATPNSANFSVKFTGTPTTGGQGKTTATISTTEPLKGTMTVTGLNAKGNKATATFTVSNTSADLSAGLTASATVSNTEYFKVTPTIALATVAKGGTTTVTVTVELIKTPIDGDKTGTVTVTLTATPKQPA